jgi:TPR repeat protein
MEKIRIYDNILSDLEFNTLKLFKFLNSYDGSDPFIKAVKCHIKTVDIDVDMAIRLYEKNINERACMWSTIMLGVLYWKHNCDYSKTLSYFQCAMSSNNNNNIAKAHAISLFATFQHQNSIVKTTELVDLFTKSANMGNCGAMYKLGKLIISTSGRVENMDKAFEWIEKAAKRGNVKAMWDIWNIFPNQLCEEKRLYWLEKSAKCRHVKSMYYFGRHLDIIGDNDTSLYWYEKAYLHNTKYLPVHNHPYNHPYYDPELYLSNIHFNAVNDKLNQNIEKYINLKHASVYGMLKVDLYEKCLFSSFPYQKHPLYNQHINVIIGNFIN